MAFFESPRFPDDVSYSSAFGPSYSTEVVEMFSGFESRDQNWSEGRLRADVVHAIKSPEALATLIAFFRIAKGKLHGFRVKDWTDFQTTTANGVLGTGVGTGGATYQINKIYTNAAGTEVRRLTKPVVGTVVVRKNGTPVVVGSGAGQIAINHTTGFVTFVAPFPGGGDSLTVECDFDVPCRFDIDQMKNVADFWNGFSWTEIPLVELRIP